MSTCSSDSYTITRSGRWSISVVATGSSRDSSTGAVWTIWDWTSLNSLSIRTENNSPPTPSGSRSQLSVSRSGRRPHRLQGRPSTSADLGCRGLLRRVSAFVQARPDHQRRLSGRRDEYRVLARRGTRDSPRSRAIFRRVHPRPGMGDQGLRTPLDQAHVSPCRRSRIAGRAVCRRTRSLTGCPATR